MQVQKRAGLCKMTPQRHTPKVYTRWYPRVTLAAATPACIPTCTMQHDIGEGVMKSYYTRISDKTYAPFRRYTKVLASAGSRTQYTTLQPPRPNTRFARMAKSNPEYGMTLCDHALNGTSLSAIPGAGAAVHQASLGHSSKHKLLG